MKQFNYFFFSIAICIFFSQKIEAQSVQFGIRTFRGLSTNTYGPMNSWNGISPFTRANRHAFIYPFSGVNAEFPGSIPTNSSITSLKFYRDTLSNIVPGELDASANIKIYIKNTALSTFSSTIIWQDTAATPGMYLLYSGAAKGIVGVKTGWVNFPLAAPLNYAGANIMVLVEYTQTASCTGSVVWSYDDTTVGSSFDSGAGVIKTMTTNAYNATQCRYSAPPVTALPFPTAALTGSNIRHPTAIFTFTTPMPIVLSRFEAKNKENNCFLTWNTSFEENISHFEIEKSNDGKIWEFLEKVKARNQSIGSNYDFEEKNVTQNAFYRLKIVSKDGTFEYSKIVNFKSKNITKWTLNNSLATGKLSISFEDNNFYGEKITIFDQNGKIILEKNIEDTDLMEFSVVDFPKGMYFVKITNQENVQRFLKLN